MSTFRFPTPSINLGNYEIHCCKCQELNPGLLGEKQERYVCAVQPPRMMMCSCRGRVAQSVERLKSPSLVQLYCTDVGSNPGRGIGVRNNCR